MIILSVSFNRSWTRNTSHFFWLLKCRCQCLWGTGQSVLYVLSLSVLLLLLTYCLAICSYISMLSQQTHLKTVTSSSCPYYIGGSCVRILSVFISLNMLPYLQIVTFTWSENSGEGFNVVQVSTLVSSPRLRNVSHWITSVPISIDRRHYKHCCVKPWCVTAKLYSGAPYRLYANMNILISALLW